MLYIIGNKKENNFKVVVGEICSGIQVNFKVAEVVNDEVYDIRMNECIV